VWEWSDASCSQRAEHKLNRSAAVLPPLHRHTHSVQGVSAQVNELGLRGDLQANGEKSIQSAQGLLQVNSQQGLLQRLSVTFSTSVPSCSEIMARTSASTCALSCAAKKGRELGCQRRCHNLLGQIWAHH
jgi:hypothetical protein